MRLKLFFSFLISAATNLAHSQALDVEWITNYGGSQWDHALATLIMPDSSLITTTGTPIRMTFDIDVNKGVPDLFVSKQKLAGEFEWINTFGGSNLTKGLLPSLKHRFYFYCWVTLNQTMAMSK
ncbi:MAG: hypothetical protein IPL12_15130 [Bacteroidetes bacterium]|nr:hypothetical protein [Bacteroidota bacterium]